MFQLSIEGKFEAGHFLPDYDGLCSNQHGHGWRVYTTYYCTTQDDIGISLDLKTLKDELKYVLAKLDHTNLNDIIEKPTAENLACWIFDELSNLACGGFLASVTVEETEGCTVCYIPPMCAEGVDIEYDNDHKGEDNETGSE